MYAWYHKQLEIFKGVACMTNGSELLHQINTCMDLHFCCIQLYRYDHWVTIATSTCTLNYNMLTSTLIFINLTSSLCQVTRPIKLHAVLWIISHACMHGKSNTMNIAQPKIYYSDHRRKRNGNTVVLEEWREATYSSKKHM